MKRNSFLLIVIILQLTFLKGMAQDFSNKGKDFWVAYGYHQVMSAGNAQEMKFYFATEAITTVTVTIPGSGYTITYPNIPANTVFTSNSIPKSGVNDARLLTESGSPENKGIHIVSTKPIVAYAHIYNASVSGATILFPTNTLGKDYYSVNYKNVSNSANANCWFYVVAADTGTTVVEITPSANTLTHAANVPFTVNLTQGQTYNVMGRLTNNSNPYMGVDLTGSRIRSISSGTGSCKRIAVFSGSGRISITCDGASSSSDNYMVQAFPKTAWGKRYLTAPTGGTMNHNIYRICVLDPATAVKLNGTPITLPLNDNFYYELPVTALPQLIEADQPILVAQYVTSQGACGNGSQPGDPEVIYLSSVEQNINKVLWNATGNFSIYEHYYNVVIPNAGTAISSFKLDGVAVSPSLFFQHPQDPQYSYLTQSVAAGQHIIESDSGFNAIAYGFGSAESYGYNAGTNVKDLYQFVTLQNQYATVNFPSACRNSPFYFYMTFPYQPTQIKWVFNGLFADVNEASPVYDSTWVINGRQLYRYKLPDSYTIGTTGTYPIKVVVQNPTPDGCSGEQEIDYDLLVFAPPSADFTFTSTGCLSDSASFLDNTPSTGRPVVKYFWDFADGNTSSLKNPKNKYLVAGSYTVSHALITDVGCVSDTAYHVISLSEPPVAKFSAAAPYCVGKAVLFSDESTIAAGTISKWYWNFGDGSPQVLSETNTAQTHIYTSAGVFTTTLKVESSGGCQSILFSKQISLNPNPVASFAFSEACLPGGTMKFTDQSTIADGSQSLFTYQWNFGDAGNDIIKDPVHDYSSTGPFSATLTVTSNNGCVDDTVRLINTIYAQPQAVFSVDRAEVCPGEIFKFTDQSIAPNNTITAWSWDFGDGTNADVQNPFKSYSLAGSYTVTLTATSASGCVSTSAVKNVVVNPLPVADFRTSLPDCINQDITFTGASIANAGNLIKWIWNYGDGGNATLLNDNSFTYHYSSAGTYNISLQVQSDKGCTSPVKTQSIRITPIPKADFGLPENCLNDPFSQFTDSSTISDGTELQFTYLWNFGDPNANAANPNTQLIMNPGHKYTVAGIYNVTLTTTSMNGCSATVTKPFSVNGTVPQAMFTIQNALSLCSDKDVTLVNTSSVDVGNIVKVEIYWDYANDPTNKFVDEDPKPGKIYAYHYPEFGTPGRKNYSIRMVSYSGINCLSTSTQVILLHGTPQIQFDIVDGICADASPVQLTQAQETAGLTGTGLFTGTGISSTGLFDPVVAGVGNHVIRYTFTSSDGCSNYKDQTIPVFIAPVVNAGPDRFMLEGGVVTLAGTASGPRLSYLWTPASGLDNALVLTPKASPSQDTYYTLKVTTANGCSDSDQVFVKILLAPIIPNAFSPNGDGINDKWLIPYLESYPGATVEVFNRYGQPIFRSVGYDKPWDGTFNGKQAPAGTYYYVVDPKNGRKVITGFVDLLR